MSNDGRYILLYQFLNYLDETPMEHDKKLLIKEIPYLEMKDFIEFDSGYGIFFRMPKYTLWLELIHELHADQILENTDGQLDYILIR